MKEKGDGFQFGRVGFNSDFSCRESVTTRQIMAGGEAPSLWLRDIHFMYHLKGFIGKPDGSVSLRTKGVFTTPQHLIEMFRNKNEK